MQQQEDEKKKIIFGALTKVTTRSNMQQSQLNMV